MEAMTMYEQDLFNEPTWVPPVRITRPFLKETIISIDVETRDPKINSLMDQGGLRAMTVTLIGIASSSKWTGYFTNWGLMKAVVISKKSGGNMVTRST